MNELMIFNNPEFGKIRMIEHAGKEYAVGVDVARALEYTNPSKAVIDHCKGITKLGIPSSGGEQETNCIPEGDIYRLITKAADQSKNPAIKEKAERLESWIFDEVLPSIRKHGEYVTPKKAQQRLGEVNSAARIIRQTLKEAGMAPEFVAVAMKSLYAPVGVEIPLEGITLKKRLYDATAIAERFGIYSENGNPHTHAVSAILAKVDVRPEEKELAPFQNARSGHAGTSYQYTESVVDKVGLWLERNGFPGKIQHNGKNYTVTYRRGVA